MLIMSQETATNRSLERFSWWIKKRYPSHHLAHPGEIIATIVVNHDKQTIVVKRVDESPNKT